jgi:hypothetical protein
VSTSILALKQVKGLSASPFVTAYLAFAYGADGDRADHGARRSEEDVVGRYGAAVQPGARQAWPGDHAGAHDGLEQAYAANSQMMAWIGRDPIFDPLRSEPRFAALVKQLPLGR